MIRLIGRQVIVLHETQYNQEGHITEMLFTVMLVDTPAAIGTGATLDEAIENALSLRLSKALLDNAAELPKLVLKDAGH